jgi:adenylosuccinate synthase
MEKLLQTESKTWIAYLKMQKNIIFAVEGFIGAKVSSISTSPERDDTILIENPFEV